MGNIKMIGRHPNEIMSILLFYVYTPKCNFMAQLPSKIIFYEAIQFFYKTKHIPHTLFV